MYKKIKSFSKELLIMFVVMVVASNIISLYKSSDLNADKLSLKNLRTIDNKFIDIDNDRPVIVHFWATWCPTCKIEASNIQTLSQNYQVISIAVKSGDNKDIELYLDKHNYDFNTINDYDGFLANIFNISAYPTTLIYDKDNNLVFIDVGYTSTIGLYLRVWLAGL
jgi:thiol-disulfide isomerase/thioredoxin